MSGRCLGCVLKTLTDSSVNNVRTALQYTMMDENVSGTLAVMCLCLKDPSISVRRGHHTEVRIATAWIVAGKRVVVVVVIVVVVVFVAVVAVFDV